MNMIRNRIRLKASREAGENPARSRHCKRESSVNKPLEKSGKAQRDFELEPGNLPVSSDFVPTVDGEQSFFIPELRVLAAS